MLNKGYQLQKKYGISIEQYEAMKEEQRYKCAICHSAPHILYVDHCHESNQVRELLCMKCNAAMGLLQDDPEIGKSMVEYLNKYADLKTAKER